MEIIGKTADGAEVVDNGMKRTIDALIGKVFNQEQLQAAYQEMREYGLQHVIGAMEGITIGSTRPNGGGYFAVYDSNGFFISTLNFAWGNTWDGRVEFITTPVWLLDLVGTEFEWEAMELSLRLARASEPDGFGAEEAWDAISEFRQKVECVHKAA